MTGQPAPDGAVLRGGGRPGGLAPTLSGTGLLADDLFLMAHDDVTGRAFLHRRVLGLGLAGGLLAELMLPGLLGIWQGRVVAASAAGPADPLGRGVLGHVLAEREGHQLRDWLTFLARTSVTDVALRLERAGYLAPAGGRWRHRGGRLVAADQDCAFASVCRGRAALRVQARTNAAPETIVNGDHAKVSISIGNKTLLLAFEYLRVEWTLCRTDLFFGDHTATYVQGELAEAATALLRPWSLAGRPAGTEC